MQSGSVLAEIGLGRNERIYSKEVHNGAVSVENGDRTQYVIYPWAESAAGDRPEEDEEEPGGPVQETPEIASAPRSLYVDDRGVIYAKYTASSDVSAAQVTWTTSDDSVIWINSTLKNGNTLSAEVRGNGPGTATVTVSLENGMSASVTIEVISAPDGTFSYTVLNPANGSARVLPNISLTQKLQIAYDVEEIALNQGYLTIYEYETDQLVEAISVSDAKRSKLNEVEFNTRYPLEPGTTYYVLADVGLVRNADAPTQLSAGISRKGDWSFTTANLSVYDRIMTEKELFLEHPEFLTGDRFLKNVNTVYGNMIASIDRYDHGMASLFYVAENIQGGDPITVLVSTVLTFAKIANLPEETQEDMVKAILLYATQSENYMNNVNDNIWVEHGTDIAEAVREVTPEGTKVEISKCIRAIYGSLEGNMPEFFPEYDETFMTGLIQDTDFDNAFVKKLKDLFGADVDTLSVFELSMIGVKIFTEYLSTRQIAVDLLITLQEEMKRAGLADDTYETLERIKSQIIGYPSLREGLVDFIPEMEDILFVFIGAVNTPLDYTKFSLGAKAVSFVYEQVAGSTEEILNVYAGAIYSAKLRCILEFEKTRFQEFRATTGDIQTFKTMYQLYIAALYQTGNALLKVDIDDQSRKQLNTILKDLEKYSYASYRDACLDYAQDYIICIGAQLEYEIRDGKAYITGFPEDTSAQTQTPSWMRTMSAAKAATESLILTSEAGEQSWLVIPEEIDGYPVAGIDDRAFEGNTTLHSVYVSAQLESVGEEAFSQCASLETVDFLQGVQSIGESAFANSSVEIVSLGSSATIVGVRAFAGCSSLQYIVTDNMDTTFAEDIITDSSDVKIIALPGSAAEKYAEENDLNLVTPEPSVQAIRVERQPDKTHYTVGETLDLGGMVLDLTMSDGSHEKATSGWLAVGETDLVGNPIVTVFYGTNSTQFTINVTESESTDSGQNSGNGGSSGSNGEMMFGISIDDAKNGSITITPKRTPRGSVVTITAKPDAGYVLDSLQVFDRSGDEIALRKSGDRYTFIMPASQVSVKAVFAKQNVQSVNLFLDVLESDYFYDAVLWAASSGITAGTSGKTFSPNAACTRAQTITMLWRAAGSPKPRSSTNPFLDVKESDYYYEAVLWAVENGITAGTGGTTFSPDAVCTRSQVITFLYRDGGTKTAGTIPFADIYKDAYYCDAVQWAVQEGITAGTGPDTFSPEADCTRAQIVTFLYCYMGK